jgi:Mrp family chromosome partitioning ATPase
MRALAVARRRKWTILFPVAVVPVALVLISLWQGPRYEASAGVLVTADAAAPSGGLPATEVDLAGTREVAVRTARAADVPGRSADDVLASSSVTANSDSGVLSFTIEDRVEAAAVRLANAYAQEYAAYRNDIETGTEASAVVVERAVAAERVAPRPLRYGATGLVVGLVLGALLAVLWEALDVRARPRRARARAFQRLAATGDLGDEALRRLASYVGSPGTTRKGRLLVFTSEEDDDEKSSTVAGLARALARTGKRVALVDLDLDRRRLSGLFGRGGAPGLGEVALGELTLEDALAAVPPAPIAEAKAVAPPADLLAEVLAIRSGASRIRELERPGAGAATDNGRGTEDDLWVLAAGTGSLDGGGLAGSERLYAILEELRDRVDVVLVDGPPLVRSQDARTVAARVGELVVVERD